MLISSASAAIPHKPEIPKWLLHILRKDNKFIIGCSQKVEPVPLFERKAFCREVSDE